MHEPVVLALGAAAALTASAVMMTGPAMASSAPPVASPAAGTSTTDAPGADPDTIVTATVTSGTLTIDAPASADLGSGLPGAVISAPIGAVTVTDDRALLAAAWTVTASETDFVQGAGGPGLTIPATDSTYDPGTISTTGTISVAAAGTAPIALSNAPGVAVVDGTAGVGDNGATWSPTVAVAVPPTAVAGAYSGTLTQSVA